MKFGDVKNYSIKYCTEKPPAPWDNKSFFKSNTKPAPNAYTHLTYETIEIDDNMMMVPLYILKHLSEMNNAKSVDKNDVAEFFTKIMTVD